MRKIRVLHGIGNLSMGGAEVQCRQLVNHLDRSGFESGIVYLHEGANPDVAADVVRFKIDRGRKYGIFGLFQRIDAAVEKFAPDLVQAWLPEVVSVPIAWSAWKRNVPVISCHRNTLRFEGDWTKMLRDRLRFPQYLIAKRIVSNFNVSEDPALFRWLYRRKAGVCVPNGVGFEELRALPRRKLPVRAEYRLIYAGRIAPQKGLPVAFGAVHTLLRQGLDIHLTLFGSGHPPYVEKLRSIVSSMGIEKNVTFFGECKEWPAYAEDAHGMIFPTRGEGTSNSVLEALGVGIPVVISNIAMSRHLLKSGENAIVVKNDDPDEWAARLNCLLKSEESRRKIIAGGLRLSQDFSTSVMVRAYESLYHEVLNKNELSA